MGTDAHREPAGTAAGPEAPTELAHTTAGAQILYDHYKESLSALAQQVRTRLRLLVFLLAVLSALVVDTLTEEPLIELLTGIELPMFTVTENLTVPPQALISLLWFVLGSLVALMNQKSLLIEEQSGYVRQLESRVDDLFGGGWIFKNRIPLRPTYLEIANACYFGTYLFILVGGGGLVLYDELVDKWFAQPAARPYFLFDLLVFVLVIGGSLVRFVVDFRRSSPRDAAAPAPPRSTPPE